MKIQVVGQATVSGDDDEDVGVIGKSKSRRFIIVEHGDNQLQWSIPPRSWNAKDETNAEVFDQINAYFAILPTETQAAIFEDYKRIHDVLRATNMQQDECEDLIEAIRPIAKSLFDHIDPAHFGNWVWTYLRPRIPATIKSAFDADTMPGTMERTYVVEDYKALIPLAIIVRMGCPFWFHFATITAKELSREHKDMLTYSLIEQAWPVHTHAMKRLEQFVDHTVGPERNNPAATLMGIGSDDYVYWVLSGMVISRLPTVDALGTNPDAPVIGALYNFIFSRVGSVISSQPAIKNKFAETSYSADENNQSYLEGFRNRIALTVGQEALGDYYLERQIEMVARGEHDSYSLIERIAPGIDYNLVIDSIASAEAALMNEPPTDEQITIAAWLLHPYSQVRTVGNLLQKRVVNLLGLAQAILLHHGKIDFALLVTAKYERKSAANESDAAFYVGETIATLRAADREAYRPIFPMEQRSRNQKKVRNFVFEDVYALVHSLQEYDITCTFSDETLRRVKGNNPNRQYFLRKDAVTMFMEYAKWLATRPIVRIDPDDVYQQLLQGTMNTGGKAQPVRDLPGNY